MWTLLLVMVTIGLPALNHAAPVQGHGGRCSFAGVLHVEGTSNYSLTFQKAFELCQSLSYKLATQEQVIEAYKKGLRTCSYGWIDGQHVAFLPHSNSPGCDSSSTEATFHSEAAEYLSDVYCFNPSAPFDLHCEDAVKSASQASTSENQVGTEKRNEDILEEALVEGFLVDVEKIDTAVMDPKPFTLPVPASKELATGTETQDATGPTNKFRFVRSAVLPPEEEGSGSGLNPGFDHLKPNPVTTRSSIIEPTKKDIYENAHDEVITEEDRLKQDTSAIDKRRRNNLETLNSDLPSKPSSHHRKGSPTWLVVLATCVVVGAILCIFAAIATKDKWYGPKKSKNTTSEEYSKAATLQLSHKEQEIVKLMSVPNAPNGKTEDFNVDEREKEYLM